MRLRVAWSGMLEGLAAAVWMGAAGRRSGTDAAGFGAGVACATGVWEGGCGLTAATFFAQACRRQKMATAGSKDLIML